MLLSVMAVPCHASTMSVSFGTSLPDPCDEDQQDFHVARRQKHGIRAAGQAPAVEIQLERPETADTRLRGHMHEADCRRT